MNTLKTIVMFTAVLSLGGYFAGNSAMAQLTATADVQGACSATPTALGFGNVDPLLHAAGTPEQTNSISNSALSNQDSVISIFGGNWEIPATATGVMSGSNTQHALGTGGPYTPLASSSPGDSIHAGLAPGSSVSVFWILLVVLDILSTHVGLIDQDITIFFTCVTPLP